MTTVDVYSNVMVFMTEMPTHNYFDKIVMAYDSIIYVVTAVQ